MGFAPLQQVTGKRFCNAENEAAIAAREWHTAVSSKLPISGILILRYIVA
jgi:hypothetical protein